MIQAVGGRCPTLVRVPENAEVWFKKALDTGCDGVVVPQIREASDVEAAVRWCMYPPDGARSVGLARAHGYGLTFQDYVDSANDRVAIVVMVEHIDAVESIEAICRVPGLDAVLVGPFDLSGSMGIPGQVGHQRVSAAIDQVRTACQRAGLPVGMFCADAATAEAALDRGFRLIALATDTLFLSRGAQRSLEQVRRAVER
jgi:2-dehydro-3-deoxyglucarate aldolase/4-hydroxy-2-oxoheptanedioate aldolase